LRFELVFKTISDADVAAANNQRQNGLRIGSKRNRVVVLIIPTTARLAPLFDASDDELSCVSQSVDGHTANWQGWRVFLS